MKLALCFLALCLRILVASETPKTWNEWGSDGTRLAESGNYQAAAQAFSQALTMAKASSIPDRQLLKISNALASAYADLGRYLEAESEWRHALVLAEKMEGRESLDYALLVASMAELPNEAGNHEETIMVIRKALDVNGRSGSQSDLARLRVLLAHLLIEGKKYGEAEALLLDLQAKPTHSKSSERLQLLYLLNDLGDIRYKQGRFAQSVDIFQEELAALESDFGSEHALLVKPTNNLATSLVKLGRLEEASGAFERASDLCSKALGSDHPTCGQILSNYSSVLRKLGRKQEAKAMAERARQIEQDSGRRNGSGAVISVESLRPAGK